MTRTVQTVLGPVASNELGRVLPHEHLLSLTPGPWLDASVDLSDPGARDEFAIECAVRAVAGLRKSGFETIVDLSPYGVVGRSTRGDNVGLLAEVSRRSGLHVVAGTATYLEAFSPDWVSATTIGQLTDQFVRDLEVGFDGTELRAGVLGEQATGLDAITSYEDKCLRAAARAHQGTGVALFTHTTHGTMAIEQMKILEEEGADLDRVVVGHMDIQRDGSIVRSILDAGACVAFDTIGKQRWDFFLSPPASEQAEGPGEKQVYWRSDESRAQGLVELVERGYGSQLLVSMDLTGAEAYLNPETHGACGYRYLDVFLDQCREQGLADRDVDRLTRENPQRLLGVEAT